MNWAGGFLAGWLASYLPTLAAVCGLAYLGVLKVELKQPTQRAPRTTTKRRTTADPPPSVPDLLAPPVAPRPGGADDYTGRPAQSDGSEGSPPAGNHAP